MEQLLTLTALIFFASSLVNVILSTIKTIVTVKSTTLIAAIVNAITFGFYTFVVKQISNVDLIVSIPLTMAANLIGVCVARWILEKFKKDKLWRISCTFSTKKEQISIEIFDKLKNYNIEYNHITQNGYHFLDIFSYTQGESALIKEIITKYNIKYIFIGLL